MNPPRRESNPAGGGQNGPGATPGSRRDPATPSLTPGAAPGAGANRPSLPTSPNPRIPGRVGTPGNDGQRPGGGDRPQPTIPRGERPGSTPDAQPGGRGSGREGGGRDGVTPPTLPGRGDAPNLGGGRNPEGNQPGRGMNRPDGERVQPRPGLDRRPGSNPDAPGNAGNAPDARPGSPEQRGDGNPPARPPRPDLGGGRGSGNPGRTPPARGDRPNPGDQPDAGPRPGPATGDRPNPGDRPDGENRPGRGNLPEGVVPGRRPGNDGPRGDNPRGENPRGDNPRPDAPPRGDNPRGEGGRGDGPRGEGRPGDNRPGTDRPDNDRPGNDRPDNDRPGNGRPGNDGQPGMNRPGDRPEGRPGNPEGRDNDQVGGGRRGPGNDRGNNGPDGIRGGRDLELGFNPKSPVRSRNNEVEQQLRDLNRQVQNVARDQKDIERAIDRGQVVPVRIGANGNLNRGNDRLDLARIQSRDQLRDLNSTADLARFFGRQDARDMREFQSLRFDRVSGRFQDQIVGNRWNNSFNRFAFYDRFQVNRQFDLYRRGDVARQMRFPYLLADRGGWRNRYYGPIAPLYTRVSFSNWYAGPRFYPRYTWFPYWSPWVRWSWWNTVPVVYDPRPMYVRPIYCEPAPVWTSVWQYPQYQQLPVVASGTWVDLPETQPVVQGVDVQLIAVRFVDSGHSEQQLGPRYRVWLKNNSQAPVQQSFNLVMLAANDDVPDASLPQSGVTIGSMEPGQITSVDIRLPYQANSMHVDSDGRNEPFVKLHLIADTERTLQDTNPENNVAVVDRNEILPVDPASFSVDTTVAAPGTMASLAGEGLGPEPGRVVIVIDGKEYDPEIYGWYDLGVQFKVPENIPSNQLTDAEVVVIRGDGAVANPVDLQIVANTQLGPAIGWVQPEGN